MDKRSKRLSMLDREHGPPTKEEFFLVQDELAYHQEEGANFKKKLDHVKDAFNHEQTKLKTKQEQEASVQKQLEIAKNSLAAREADSKKLS